jgi:hypothetical protein
MYPAIDPSEPLVVRLARQFREAISAQLDDQMFEMGQNWLNIEYSLSDKVNLLLNEIRMTQESGQVVSKTQITQLARYKELREQVHEQIRSYNGYAEDLIKKGQYRDGLLGIKAGKDTIYTAYSGYGVISSAFNILPIDAIESMVGFLGDGSPLSTLLRESYPYAWQGMSDELVRGITLGLPIQETARNMADGLSEGLNRIMRIARTEQLRSFRTATVMQYRESGVVQGFKRLANKATACMACLMSDGEYFAVAEDFTDHPNGACTCVPILKGLPEREWQTGEDYFSGLSPDQQKERMGAQYYQAWKDGQFKLSDLRGTAHSDIWGDSPQVVSLGKLIE